MILINYYTVKLIRELLYWKVVSESEHLKVAIFIYALGLILCGVMAALGSLFVW